MRPALVLGLVALSLALMTRPGSAQKPEPLKSESGAPDPNKPDREAIARAKAEPKLGRLTTIGGSVLDGTVVTETIRFKCDLGELEIPFWQVGAVVNQRDTTAARASNFSDLLLPTVVQPSPGLPPSEADPAGSQPFKIGVMTEDGAAILAGEFVTKEFKLSCGFGVMSVPWDKVALIDFVRRAEPVRAPVRIIPVPDSAPLAPSR